MNNFAMITDIQRFSLHDGPGVRTTVFFKGCNLNCAWCHNPETMKVCPQIMYDRTRCVVCGFCVSVCPEGALQLTSNGLVKDPVLCKSCMQCVHGCYHDAMRAVGQLISVNELIEMLQRDILLFGSTGGVTFSGGEPLMQAEFVFQTAKKLHEVGVHTAIDTAGCLSKTSFDTVFPVTDLWLYDIKAMDEDIHIQNIGNSNRQILDNLRYLSDKGARIWIRRPMVNNVNDMPEDTKAFCTLLKSLPGVEKVELLLYHDYGTSKTEGLGEKIRKYAAPDNERMEKITQEILKTGVQIFVRK